ncbi:MAG: S8 family peptidase [Pseudomonadota bacterium]
MVFHGVARSLGLLCVPLFCLGACGGGGGGISGEDGFNQPSTGFIGPVLPARLRDPSIGSPTSDWHSNEYFASGGLDAISAAQGYASRTHGHPGGALQRVAVLDSGVQADHPEFDSVEVYGFRYDDLRDLNGHGSSVAGIIAARRDGLGVHGVAYNARPVSIKVLRDRQVINGMPMTVYATASDVAAGIYSAAGISRSVQRYDSQGQPAIRYIPGSGYEPDLARSFPAAESSVMNLSLGGPDPRKEVYTAMRAAASRGKIMVTALGNDRVSGASNAPAIYVDGMDGLALAVAALRPDGSRLASFSNRCGALYHCLSAPGQSITTAASRHAGSGAFRSFSGTSAAAPHVSGAAALALAAFPGVSPKQVVERILATADDLGDQGWDSVYGHGRLNIESLMSPVGSLSVPVSGGVSGASQPVTAFQAVSGPGGAVIDLAAVSGEIMALDEMGFPFSYDLTEHGTTHQRSQDDRLDTFIDPFETTQVQASSPTLGLSVFGISPDRFIPDPVRDPGSERRTSFQTTSFSYEVSPRMKIGFSSGTGPEAEFSGLHNSLVSTGILGAEMTDVEMIPFSGDGDTIRTALALDENTWIEQIYHEGDGYYGENDTNTLMLGLRHWKGPIEIGVRYGQTAEQGAIAGAVYSGFAEDIAATTSTLALDLGWHASPRVSASIGYAMSQIDPSSSGLTQFGMQTGDSASVALSLKSLKPHQGRITFVASLPYATRNGSAVMDVPVARTVEGDVIYQARSADLSVQRRERALQAVYNRRIGKDASMDIAAYSRFNADHVAGREDIGAAFRIRVTF